MLTFLVFILILFPVIFIYFFLQDLRLLSLLFSWIILYLKPFPCVIKLNVLFVFYNRLYISVNSNSSSVYVIWRRSLNMLFYVLLHKSYYLLDRIKSVSYIYLILFIFFSLVVKDFIRTLFIYLFILLKTFIN